MPLTATYNGDLSRVQLAATGLPQPTYDWITAHFQRSTNGGAAWTTVRGGGAVTIVGGAAAVDDFEFSDGVVNDYRVVVPTVVDTFTRTVANGWGTADTGQVWSTSGGVAGNYSVGSGHGIHIPTAVNSSRNTVLPVNVDDATIRAAIRIPQLATGGPLMPALFARRVDGSNMYLAEVLANSDQTMTARIRRFEAAVGTQLATATLPLTHAAATWYAARWELDGPDMRLKVWTAGAAEPATWSVEAADSTFASGGAGARSAANTGNTNVNPELWYDDLLVDDGFTTTLMTASITPDLAGDACDDTPVWIKSIARPFLNRPVAVVQRGEPTITRRSRAGVFDIVGRSFPIAVSDLRSSRQWTMYVRTYSHTDAQEMDLILASGDPLYVQVPAGCAASVPGGYVSVGDTTQSWHPLRPTQCLWTLPLTEVAPPGPDVVGVTISWQGVINSYSSWSTVIAGNATWADLLADVGSYSDVIVP